MELGALLEDHGFTSLSIVEGRLLLRREWNDDVDWSRFNQDFETDSLPCTDPKCLGGEEARALISRGAADALAHLLRGMTEGRHQMVSLKVEPRLGIRAALFVHSSRLGHNNGLHAVRAGGFRRHGPDELERDVFEDGLNLARAMSYKNAAAELPLGGCKMTVQCDPVDPDDRGRLGFLAYTIESGRFLTGPDMGFLPEHADAMRARYTRHVTGGRNGVLGPTGTPTALGCFLAIEEAAKDALGGLAGRTAAIQGLGAVGLPLAGHLAQAGMKLIVADPDEGAVEKARALGDVRVVSPDRILLEECDLLAPCAFGGLIDEEMIGKLSCKMLYGSANNPLVAISTAEELHLADRLAERGILFQIEWTHNTAGVMSGFEEYIHGDQATAENLRPRLERVCRDGTRRLLDRAKSDGKTPTAVAYEEIERKIYA